MEKKNAEFSNEKFNRISENYSLNKKNKDKEGLGLSQRIQGSACFSYKCRFYHQLV